MEKKDKKKLYKWGWFKHSRCLVHHDRKIVFVEIPKNMSTSVKVSLQGKEGITKDFFDLFENSEYEFLVVTRDPIQRWVSGIAEYICHGKRAELYNKIEKNNTVLLDWIYNLEDFTVGVHTLPQTWYLEGINGKITTFDIKESEKLFEYAKSHGFFIKPAMINASLNNNRKAIITEILIKHMGYADNYFLRQCLVDHYAADYIFLAK